MADGQHKLSRRAVLGAVCSMPVLSEVEGPLIPRHPGLDPGSMNTVGGEPGKAVFMDSGLCRNDGEWDTALARFHEAQTVLDAARHDEDEDACDRLLDSHSEAVAALLALPAPDLPGLAAKLDVIVPQMAWELAGCEDCLERLRRDAHRLAATAA